MRLLFILLAFTAFMDAASMANAHLPAEKVLLLKVDELGIVNDGRDTISSDNIARYIRERLFKNYMGTGKMYSLIKLQRESGNIPLMIMDVLVKEIIAGQKAALTELCLHKYKKLFNDLDTKQQAKLKKHFPVLFQVEFY